MTRKKTNNHYLLSSAKNILGLSNITFDNEIIGLIDAGQRDLEVSGIFPPKDKPDPLFERAVLTYVNANYGADGNSEKLQRKYDAIKLNMRESGEYNAVD